MPRNVNRKLLRNLVRTFGKKGTVAETAEGLGVSEALLEKLMSGKYKATLKEATRFKICSGLRASEDELFPALARRKKKAS